MSDEDELREREQTFLQDRRNQAKWYESLNLYAEAMKIYKSIKDEDNIQRLSSKMSTEYTKNALQLEKMGKFQEAANLYYLIGDLEGVGRMKKLKPDLVIIYDETGGGLAQVAKELGSTETDETGEEYFSKMNPGDDFEGGLMIREGKGKWDGWTGFVPLLTNKGIAIESSEQNVIFTCRNADEVSQKLKELLGG